MLAQQRSGCSGVRGKNPSGQIGPSLSQSYHVKRTGYGVRFRPFSGGSRSSCHRLLGDGWAVGGVIGSRHTHCNLVRAAHQDDNVASVVSAPQGPTTLIRTSPGLQLAGRPTTTIGHSFDPGSANRSSNLSSWKTFVFCAPLRRDSTARRFSIFSIFSSAL
jgi:hypothetical protein